MWTQQSGSVVKMKNFTSKVNIWQVVHSGNKRTLSYCFICLALIKLIGHFVTQALQWLHHTTSWLLSTFKLHKLLTSNLPVCTARVHLLELQIITFGNLQDRSFQHTTLDNYQKITYSTIMSILHFQKL